MKVAGLGMISEVDPLPGVSDDVLGARVLAVASPHQSLGNTKKGELRAWQQWVSIAMFYQEIFLFSVRSSQLTSTYTTQLKLFWQAIEKEIS